MMLLAINMGLTRDIDWRGKMVRTSIVKSPVPGRVRVMRLNIEGDQQSGLSVHGEIAKAV
jgi:MOSC domain-containing protein YiiM